MSSIQYLRREYTRLKDLQIVFSTSAQSSQSEYHRLARGRDKCFSLFSYSSSHKHRTTNDNEVYLLEKSRSCRSPLNVYADRPERSPHAEK